MIDWKKSADLNNCSIDKLKARFKKFPGSNKKIIAICDNPDCRRERELYYHGYHELCISCSNSINMLKYYDNNPEKKYNLTNNVEELRHDLNFTIKLSHKQSKSAAKRWEKPEEHEKVSKSTRKRYTEMDDPGQEIVKHHYIYDFNDLSKYTIEITRSEHTTIHNNLRFVGLEVPCINIMVGD